MKRLYLFLLLCMLSVRAWGQTTLLPGDLAIVGVEFNVASQCGTAFGTDDMFAIVTFRAIENGTKIIFTDRAFLRSEDNCQRHYFRPAEGLAIFERTGGTLPAGSIFYVYFGGAPPVGIPGCNACSPGWTITLPTGQSPDMNTNGDQLFILQGDYQLGGKDCAPLPNLDVFEGTIIYAVTTNPITPWIAGQAPDDCTDGQISSFPSNERSRVSYFPPCFSNCLRINIPNDRGYLRNLPTIGTKELLLGYIGLNLNWVPGTITISPTNCLDASNNVETDFSKYKFSNSDFVQGPINVTSTGQNGVWRGLVSDDWFDACNWSNFTLPDSTIDVSIPSTAFNNCVIRKAQQTATGIFATCRNLTVQNASRPLILTDDPVLRVFGNIDIAGGLSAFQTAQGTVELRGGAANTTIAAAGNQLDFFNLRLNRTPTSTVDLGNVNVRISNLLDLRRGRFTASGTGQLTVTNPTTGAVTNSSGLPFTENDPNTWVVCPLQRNITQAGADYAFPVGSPTNGQLFRLEMISPSDYTDLRVRFVPGPSIGLPLSGRNEGGNENYSDYLDIGWWEATGTPAAPATLGIYNVSIHPQDVPPQWANKDYTERRGNASVSIAKAPDNTYLWDLDGEPDKSSHLNANARVARTDIPTGFSKFAIVIDANKPFAIDNLRLNLKPEPGQGLRLDWEFDATSVLAWRLQRSTRLPQFETLVEDQPNPDAIRRELPARYGSYLDRTVPCDQTVWYRLEIVEGDGQITRSEIVEGRYSCTNARPLASVVRVYPNPFDNHLNIDLGSETAGRVVSLELIDALGRSRERLQASVTDRPLQWDLTGLPAGVYTLRIVIEGQTHHLRLLAR